MQAMLAAPAPPGTESHSVYIGVSIASVAVLSVALLALAAALLLLRRRQRAAAATAAAADSATATVAAAPPGGTSRTLQAQVQPPPPPLNPEFAPYTMRSVSTLCSTSCVRAHAMASRHACLVCRTRASVPRSASLHTERTRQTASPSTRPLSRAAHRHAPPLRTTRSPRPLLQPSPSSPLP